VITGAQSEVVELDGMAPASRGTVFADGWDGGVVAVSEAVVGIADRDWAQRGGRSTGAAELAVLLADVRQRERADLVRPEAFVRKAVLPHTREHHGAAPGAGGAGRGRRSVHRANGGAIQRRRHLHPRGRALRPGRQALLQGRKARGWHLAGASIWSASGAACYPHTAV
jgi:hypothetical protein